ncbi:MAG: protein kinase [Bacteroidales bacterium]|nr:protein kinase [Bacteroidales bacterium]
MNTLPSIPYYKTIRLIQEGGTSAVYEAIDLRSGNKVAIKALFSNKAKDAFMLKRFREEANHYLLLSHPNLPKLVDFIIDDGQMYLVMEYVEGIDMNKYLQANGPLDEDMTVHFFTMILDTIGYLHKQGILHLDIKPANIMVTDNLGIKILDLGISAKVSEGETLKKKCGSPSFMAPEQTQGEKLGCYTDIYQIGVTLFNMVTGQLPYGGNTQQEIFDSVCNAPIPQLKDFSDAVNPSLQTVIDKSMQKNGADRYASCKEFEEALLESLSATIEEEQPATPSAVIEKPKNKEQKVKEKANDNDMKIITVGRETGNDVVIPDSFVGRHHLQLIKDEAGAYFVRDLDSTNGTFVNGKRIYGEVAVDEQDVIRIGNTTLPWISYFAVYNKTEVAPDDEETKSEKRRKRRKKTQEEKQASKDKRKKAVAGAGKWILRTLLAIGTSVIMMLVFRMIMGRR